MGTLGLREEFRSSSHFKESWGATPIPPSTWIPPPAHPPWNVTSSRSGHSAQPPLSADYWASHSCPLHAVGHQGGDTEEYRRRWATAEAWRHSVSSRSSCVRYELKRAGHDRGKGGVGALLSPKLTPFFASFTVPKGSRARFDCESVSRALPRFAVI